ncbi:ATP-binding protein [Candidatus Magnetominusculus dajiuhuensis]|uniref:ATP-binding protein n=1 Tax=Candidatus Magnetominusculus dajiuhuensis TaxID=3137712 RepID=UPI003B437ABC
MTEQFFTSNMGYVYLVYGFAFISMGALILVQPKTYGLFRLTRKIWLLAMFALLHGVNEWLDMAVFIYPAHGILKMTAFVFMMLSFCFLFEFGRRLVKTDVSLDKLSRLLSWWLMPTVSVLILVITFSSREWLITGQILPRYFIALPGTILTAIGLNAYRKETDNIEASRLNRFDTYLKIAAACFIAYGFFAGLVVPKGGFFPSNILNAGGFLSVVHIPVQVFRAIAALIIAFSIVVIVRIISKNLATIDVYNNMVNQYNLYLSKNIRDNKILSYLTGFLFIAAIIIMIITVHWIKDRAINIIHNNALERVNIYNRHLNEKLSHYEAFPKLLSGRPYVIEHANRPGEQRNMNEYLYNFSESIGASLSCVINTDGMVTASSNYDTPASLVGKNLSYREYFQSAMKDIPFKYVGIGAFTKIPGLFLSYPIKNGKDITGVVVVKFDSKMFMPNNEGSNQLFFIVDNNGVIFYSSDERYNYYTEIQLPETELQRIKDNRQYADEPLLPLPIIKKSEANSLTFVTMRHKNLSGNGFADVEYLQEEIYDNRFDWHVVLFTDVSTISGYVSKSAMLAFILIAVVLIGCILLIKKSKTKIMIMNNYINYFIDAYGSLSEKNKQIENHKRDEEILNSVLYISLSPDPFEVKLQSILNFILIHSRSSFQSKGCLFICNEKAKTLQMEVSKDFSKEQALACSNLPYGKCLCGLAAATRKVVFLSDCNEDEHLSNFENSTAHGHYCIPIMSSAELLGVINIYVEAGYHRNDPDEQFLMSIAHILAVVIQRNKEMQILEMDRSASVTTLAAGIAHEINNPLSFIKTSVSTLNKYLVKIEPFVRHSQISPSHESLSGEQIQALQRDKILDMLSMMGNKINSSNRGIERIMEVVNALKMFSRLNKEGFTDVDINRCIDETLSILITGSRNVNIIKEYSELPTYLCEPQAMNQCFYHIIENAIHAVDVAGTGNITISTSHIRVGEAQDETIQVRITDDGTGMSEETVKRAFVPFYTTKEVGSGKGLGLSIVDGVIKRHGGTVDIESTVGKGTSVTIQLRLGQNV